MTPDEIAEFLDNDIKTINHIKEEYNSDVDQIADLIEEAMGMGIGHGAYLVTFKEGIGGNRTPDISMVVGGRGVASDPWQVKSLLTNDRYTVRAKDIVSDSYYENQTLQDAEIIYRVVAEREPKYFGAASKESERPPDVPF